MFSKQTSQLIITAFVCYDSIPESKQLQRAVGGLESDNCFAMVMNHLFFLIQRSIVCVFLSFSLSLSISFFTSNSITSLTSFLRPFACFFASFVRRLFLLYFFLFLLENQQYAHTQKYSLVFVLWFFLCQTNNKCADTYTICVMQ